MSKSTQVLPSRLLIVVLALAAIFLLLSTRVQAEQPVTVTERIVMPGDTLWGIAETITHPGDDVRVSVGLLKRINDMETSSLRAGQVLLIPAG